MVMPSPTDAAELQAIHEGVDAARKQAEATWGAERLPLIIGDEWRIKLRRQQARYSTALQEAWAAERVTAAQIDTVRSAAGGMVRAWAKLDEVATEAGHRPLSVDVWEILLADGSVAALVRDNDAAAKVIADGRHLHVYTPAEIANVIDALPAALKIAKVVFPGAKLQGSGDMSWVRDGDAIPFPFPPDGEAEAA